MRKNKSKIFEALLKSAGESCKKGGEILNSISTSKISPVNENKLDSTPVSQYTSKPDSKPDSTPVSQYTSKPDSTPVSQYTSKPDSTPVSQYTSKPDDLTSRQFMVLKFVYFNRPFKVDGKNNSLSNIENMGRGNARNQLDVLVKRNYISKPYGINKGLIRGSTCRVNEKKCLKFFGPTHIINPPEKKIVFHFSTDDNQGTSTPVSQYTGKPNSTPVSQYTSKPNSTPVSQLYSSSLTTNYFMKGNPEFGYWNRKGLNEQVYSNWCESVGCDGHTLLRYLSYCRFEMVDLGVEESKPVDNVLNWFFKILERTGGYPKPKGYKSFEEKRIEEERELLAEQERLAKEKEEIYRAKIKAERDAKFFEIMSDTNHELYKKCFEKLNQFVRGRKGKKSFEMAMRKVFDELEEGEE